MNAHDRIRFRLFENHLTGSEEEANHIFTYIFCGPSTQRGIPNDAGTTFIDFTYRHIHQEILDSIKEEHTLTILRNMEKHGLITMTMNANNELERVDVTEKGTLIWTHKML